MADNELPNKDGLPPVAGNSGDHGDPGTPGASGPTGQGSVDEDKLLRIVSKALSPLAERTATLEKHLTSLIERPSGSVPGASGGAPGGPGVNSELQERLKNVDFLDRPQESAYAILGLAQEMASNIVETRMRASEARKTFFDNNEDLKGNEYIVESVYRQVAAEKPHLQGNDLAKELADRSRREIARIRAANPTVQTIPPRVEPGGGNNPPPAPGPDKPISQEEEVSDYTSRFKKKRK